MILEVSKPFQFPVIFHFLIFVFKLRFVILICSLDKVKIWSECLAIKLFLGRNFIEESVVINCVQFCVYVLGKFRRLKCLNCVVVKFSISLDIYQSLGFRIETAHGKRQIAHLAHFNDFPDEPSLSLAKCDPPFALIRNEFKFTVFVFLHAFLK